MSYYKKENPKILVLGAGVVGMNTALRLQEDIPNIQLTIRAEHFTPHTTSNVAAGIFRPSSWFQGPNPQITEDWLQNSWEYYQQLRREISPREHGIFELPLYLFASKYPAATRNSFLQKFSSCYRVCKEDDFNVVQPKGKYKYGSYSHTILTDCDYYLPWAMGKIKEKGGIFEKKRMENLEELNDGEFDVVVNCTGFGAKQLFDDPCMTANRGQIFKVKAPWIRMAIYGDYDTYVIPGMDYVTLGGTRQLSNLNDDIDEDDSKAIWSKVTTMLPSLEKAEIICQSSAWRPTRKFVRVEKELLFDENLKVVHHYGHCGYGVMSSPGSAVTASQLVKEMLQGDFKNAVTPFYSKL